MKDPQERLSWPELLSHPFIAGRVTGEYIFSKTVQVCFLLLLSGDWEGPPCPAIFTILVYASLLSAFSKH